MKLNKFFMLGLAGLAFAACSNEEELSNGIIDGPADVAVAINLPGNVVTSRGVAAPTTSNAVIVNSVVLTLACDGGDKTKTLTATQDNPLTSPITATFEGVENPTNLSVTINGTVKTTLADLQETTVAGTALKGETSKFSAGKQGGKDVYTATVDMEHTMARLEFSGLVHKEIAGSETEAECRFTSATLSGIFLNKVALAPTGNATTWNEGDVTAANNAFFTTTCPVADALNKADFLTNKTALPENSECYAYNIYPVAGAANLPVLTLYFTNVALNEDAAENTGAAWPVSNGYAMVSTYKVSTGAGADVRTALTGAADGTDIINFPAGYIYQVTKLEVADENIHPTLGGGFDLIATVNVIPWTIVQGEVEWK